MARQTFDWLRYHARMTPEKCALIDLGSDRRLSYRDLDQRVDALTHHLARDLGLSRGDVIGVLGHNSTDILEIQFACRRLAARFLPLNWRLTAPELEYVLRDAEVAALFVGPEFAATGEAAARDASVRQVRTMGGSDADYECGLASHLGAGPYTVPVVDEDEVWTIMYTSGTTGRPKGATLTYGQFECLVGHLVARVGLSTASVNLSVLPMFHISGINTYAVPVLYLGGTTYIMRAFDAARCLALISDPAVGLSHFMGVPTHFLFMQEQPGFAAARFDHLASVISGGQAVPLPMVEAFGARGMQLQQGWGMTETCSLIFLLDQADIKRKRGSVGKAVMNVEVRIVDDQLRDVAPGEVGELLLRGPQISRGYINNPDANASSWVDGWFRTGDAFRVDEDGFYFIVDRWKDMYISGGENVYPAEVERAIVEMPEVLEVAVIGVPHPRWGECGRAFIVPRAGASGISAAKVIEHCRTRLARYKVPAEVIVCEELPHTAAGKVHKRALSREALPGSA